MHENNTNEHNDPTLERLFIKARTVALAFPEKDEIYSRLETVMSEPRLRVHSIYDFLKERRPMAFALIAGLIVLSGNGVASAAQHALPGDLLYPWKIHVNEKIVASLAGSPEARAEIETVQAATRLTEIEKLALEERLTPALQAQAEANFSAHADNAIAEIRTLGKRGKSLDATEAGNELESVLSAHREVIASLPARAASGSPVAKGLATVERGLTNALIAAVQTRTEAEYSLATSSDPSSLKIAAESVRDTSFRSLTNARNTLKTDTQVTEAATFQSKGAAKLDSGSYSDAIMLFGQANRHANSAAVRQKVEKDIGYRQVKTVISSAPITPVTASTTPAAVGVPIHPISPNSTSTSGIIRNNSDSRSNSAAAADAPQQQRQLGQQRQTEKNNPGKGNK